MLKTVTISGADDRVSPSKLLELSERFPFVEWGILLSQSRAGRSRYPSPKWLCKLRETTQGSQHRIKLSAHLCGSNARRFMDGEDVALKIGEAYVGVFERIQINGFDMSTSSAFIEKAQSMSSHFEFILQAQSERAIFACTWVASAIERCSVLFDPSGGRGTDLRTAGLPRHVEPWLPLGFAGGIDPDNAEEIVGLIDGRGFRRDRADVWIDMESGVRTNDEFDIEKVVRVLTSMERWVQRGVPQ